MATYRINRDTMGLFIMRTKCGAEKSIRGMDGFCEIRSANGHYQHWQDYQHWQEVTSAPRALFLSI